MILITGATGNIGTELVKRLVNKRTPIRVITRDEKKIAQLGPKVGRVIGDRHEPSVVQRALQDVEKVFVLSGPFDIDHEADRLLMTKAKNAGVRQIVLISSSNVHLAGKNSVGVFHREKEMLVEKSGIPWTFLRPGAFMSNALKWVNTIKSQVKSLIQPVMVKLRRGLVLRASIGVCLKRCYTFKAACDIQPANGRFHVETPAQNGSGWCSPHLRRPR